MNMMLAHKCSERCVPMEQAYVMSSAAYHERGAGPQMQ